MVVVMVMMLSGAGLGLRDGSEEAEGGCDQGGDEQFFHGRSCLSGFANTIIDKRRLGKVTGECG
jgi:hypothetical protein